VTQPITPYLLYADTDAAVRFASDAFGFREVERVGGAGGGVHVELRLEETGAQLYLGSPAEGFRNPAEVGRTSLGPAHKPHRIKYKLTRA
jgi:catechol 2,3-dioxygenase-like lactoylglutathione lyase family enzyme